LSHFSEIFLIGRASGICPFGHGIRIAGNIAGNIGHPDIPWSSQPEGRHLPTRRRTADELKAIALCQKFLAHDAQSSVSKHHTLNSRIQIVPASIMLGSSVFYQTQKSTPAFSGAGKKDIS